MPGSVLGTGNRMGKITRAMVPAIMEQSAEWDR